MARNSAGAFIVRTALRGVIYYGTYRGLERVRRSDHPLLYFIVIFVGLALLYAIVNQ